MGASGTLVVNVFLTNAHDPKMLVTVSNITAAPNDLFTDQLKRKGAESLL